MKAFESDFSCPIILNEVLHGFGIFFDVTLGPTGTNVLSTSPDSESDHTCGSLTVQMDALDADCVLRP